MLARPTTGREWELMLQLQIQYPDGRRTALDLTGEEWLIGRDETCEVSLDDAATSRRHARLYLDTQGRFWVQDLQSKNGTFLNERGVSKAEITPRDRLAVGGCIMRVIIPESPSIVLSDPGSAITHATTNAWGREQRVTLAQRRLESLYEFNERLTGRFNREDLLSELLEICMENLRFERAGVAVWAGEPASPPQWVLIRNLCESGETEIRLSRSIVDRALHHGERILITDTSGKDFDPTASMIASNIRSAMCVPMEYHDKVRGVIYGDRVSSAGGYTKEDIDYFAALGRLGAMGLANVQLVEEMQQRQRAEMQLQLAREIQSQLFPTEPLKNNGVEIDALNDPGQKVSGDYYDYFVRPDGLIAVIIADVSGKGAPAAMLMANLQAAVQVTLAEEADLVKVVGVLNRLICRNVQDSKFITGIFGLLDTSKRIFTYVNAGHLGPYLIHESRTDNRVEKIAPDATLPLGIELNEPYVTQQISLGAEPATLLLYTDGVPDAENPQGEQFGEVRFAETIAASVGEAPTELVTRLRRSIKQFARNHPQTDDITLVAVRLS